MGIHSGPVSEVTDVNGRTNIAGAGINMAQRVMDCGDAGHILLSKHVAEEIWKRYKIPTYLYEAAAIFSIQIQSYNARRAESPEK